MVDHQPFDHQSAPCAGGDEEDEADVRDKVAGPTPSTTIFKVDFDGPCADHHHLESKGYPPPAPPSLSPTPPFSLAISLAISIALSLPPYPSLWLVVPCFSFGGAGASHDASASLVLPAGGTSSFTRPSKIHFSGLPRLERPLRWLASTLFPAISDLGGWQLPLARK